MDDNNLGSLFLTMIESNYLGGTAKFTEEGGLIALLDKKVMIYHPNFPAPLISVLDLIAKSLSITVTIVKEINFHGINPSSTLQQLKSVGDEIMKEYRIPTISFNPPNKLILVCTIPFAAVTEGLKEVISDLILSKVQGIKRGCLLIGNQIHFFESDGTSSAPQTGVTLEQERVTITNDLITNLKITLAGEQDSQTIIDNL